MRILITGSRTWDDAGLIHEVLDEYYHDYTFVRDDSVTLVSGACPIGADYICENYADDCGWNIERHPANWDEHGKAAGFIRNADMVSLGADICLAFIRNESKGATMTASIALKAGLAVRTFVDNTPVYIPKHAQLRTLI